MRLLSTFMPGSSMFHSMKLLLASPRPAPKVPSQGLPGRCSGLHDRGAIQPGLRADLILIEEDALQDIRATRSIPRIWCGGIEHAPIETGK
jgi:alpha-D-ribose 1-methylphosphonate 5-triphosphate diphosphatase PhnM